MAPPTKYLQYDLGVLTRLYAQEPGLTLGMPYVHLQRWSIRDHEAAKNPMRVEATEKRFVLNVDKPRGWREVTERGLVALEQDGHDLKRSEVLVRVTSYDEATRVLSVHPAEYNDQRRSNLILDFEVDGHPTLRQMLLSEYGPRLPALDDPRLANTLGIALMVIIRKGDRLMAYCVRRAKKGVAVFQNTWSCTASGAAKWTARTGDNVYIRLVADMLEELDEEVGLQNDDLTFFMPVALSREVVRGGKPELMFLAGCRLDEVELRERRRGARRLASRLKQPLEVEPDTLLQSAARFIDLAAPKAEFFSAEIAHQATGLLLAASDQYDAVRDLL